MFLLLQNYCVPVYSVWYGLNAAVLLHSSQFGLSHVRPRPYSLKAPLFQSELAKGTVIYRSGLIPLTRYEPGTEHHSRESTTATLSAEARNDNLSAIAYRPSISWSSRCGHIPRWHPTRRYGYLKRWYTVNCAQNRDGIPACIRYLTHSPQAETSE
jgi:hypothetical protein